MRSHFYERLSKIIFGAFSTASTLKLAIVKAVCRIAMLRSIYDPFGTIMTRTAISP